MEQLEVADMRILVTGCSSEQYWYRDSVGEIFKAESFSHRDFYVRINGYLRGILRKDAEFLNKKSPKN